MHPVVTYAGTRLARGCAAAAMLAAATGLLSACGSTPEAAPPVTKTVTVSPSAAPSAPAATPVASTSTPAGPGSCLPSDLQASLGQSQGAAGTFYVLIVLTNTSASDCTLYGYPGVSFVTGQGGSVIGAPATRNTLIHDTLITLKPGGKASALVGVTDIGALSQSKCKPSSADWLQIYPPGDTGSLFVQYSAQVCTNPAQKYMTTTAMHAGAASSSF